MNRRCNNSEYTHGRGKRIKEFYTKGGDGKWIGGFFFPPNRTDMTNSLRPKKFVPNSLASFGITPEVEIPASFDWRNKIELSPVLDQSGCGSCFAMASASAISDRIIVSQYQTNSPLTNVVINPLQLLVCSRLDSGCGGGAVFNILTLGINSGAADQTSSPFWSDWCNSSACCTRPDPHHGCGLDVLPGCGSYKNDRKYKLIDGSVDSLYDERNLDGTNSEETINKIKRNILLYGPAVSSYQVFEDFQYGSVHTSDVTNLWPSTGGIYIYDGASANSGGHSVAIVGWGKKVITTYGEVPYWIVKNSWGTKWGEGGYFKMAMRDPSRNINVETGLDVPVVIGRTGDNYDIFGGAYSFQMDLSTVPNVELDRLKNCCFSESGACSKVQNCEPPNYVVSDCGKCSSGRGSGNKKWIVWAVVGVVIVLALIMIFSR